MTECKLGVRREASALSDGYQEGAALTLEINKTRPQDDNVERTTLCSPSVGQGD
jgi:hypothetical protein